MTDLSAPAPPGEASDRLYFRQLLAGRDFAVDDPVARQMVNFVYLVGDRRTDAVVVDPAYAVDEILGVVEADGMRLVGALATHYHPDHVGGDMMGWGIEGITRLLELAPVPIHVQADEAPWVSRSTGVGPGDLVTHGGGDVVEVGSVPITLVHTPGHTPGSQCFLVDGRLIAGDTLFLDGCGRTDLPGGDPEDDLPLYSSHDRDGRGDVRVADHPAGAGAGRDRALPRAPVLAGSVGHHGPHPLPQLRIPLADSRAVDGHVRALSPLHPCSMPRLDARSAGGPTMTAHERTPGP